MNSKRIHVAEMRELARKRGNTERRRRDCAFAPLRLHVLRSFPSLSIGLALLLVPHPGVASPQGAPEIDGVSAEVVRLRGGERLVVTGRNFTPETVVTYAEAVVTDLEVIGAEELRLRVPPVESPGSWTLTVATRGGMAQREIVARARPLSELEPGEITTVVGGMPGVGDGGPATDASVASPSGLAFDAAGNLFVADTDHHRVRRVDAATGRITTIAGTGLQGYNGDDKPATAARLRLPTGVAVDAAGNVFVADSGNHRVRRVDAATGRITTVAGTGERGYDGDDQPAAAAALNWPTGVAVDAAGNLFVADRFDHRVRRVEAATGLIATVAGTGKGGYDGDRKPATAAQLNEPVGVALDAAGNLFVADRDNHRVRRVDAVTGRIRTVKGIPDFPYGGPPGFFFRPEGVAVDAAGNLFVAATGDHRVFRLSAETRRLSAVVGRGVSGYGSDGVPAAATNVAYPRGLAVDAAGNLFVTDEGIAVTPYDEEVIADSPDRVRRVDAATGLITTVVGPGVASDDELAVAARLSPDGVAVDAAGNLFVAETYAHRVRRVDAATGRITTVAGTGSAGYGGDGELATTAPLNSPTGLAVDTAGNLFIADRGNHRVRRVDAATGRIRTVAGTGMPGYVRDGYRATIAQLSSPSDVAVDAAGNLFIADTSNGRVRRVDAGTGRITTVAGTGEYDDGGDGGPAKAAALLFPADVTVDAAGNFFVADRYNHRVRRVDALTGRIETVAGTGMQGYNGDGQPAAEAWLSYPTGLAVDAAGNLFVADTSNGRVRRVDAATGLITTVAGTGVFGYAGDNGSATTARLSTPADVAVDSAGNLFVVDPGNHAIRAVKGL
jgi:sugar lactone lactonase YvrE